MDKWPERWKVFALSEICEVKDGTHDSPKFQLSGFPLVTSKNLRNNNIDLSHVKFISQNDYDSINKRSKVEKGDILFAMIGTIGNPVLIKEEPRFAIKNIALFKKSEHVIPDFLVYFLGSNRTLDRMISEAKGATQKFVGLGYLRKFPIPLPPLPEQKRIVSKLDALFERIDQSIALLEENIKNTEALMASALDEVFLQLAPFSKALKISDFAEVKGGKRLPKGFKVQEDKTEFPYIRVADFLDNGTINMSNLQYISHDAHEKIKRYIITSENLYISIAGTIGKTGIIPKELDGANLTENAARLVYKNPSSINNRYIYFFTLSDKFKQQIKEATKTVAQPKLALTRLKNIELPVPTINIQNEAVNKFDSISSKTYALMKEQKAKLNHLKSLKESILDKAFKGEI